MLALAATVAWMVVDHQRTEAAIAAATADLETHRSELVVAQSELASDLADAKATLTSSEGRVDDDAVRTELEDVIANGTGLVAPLDLIGPAASDLDMLTIQDAFVLSHTDDVARHSLALAAAVTSVDEAVVEWELSQAGAALDTALTSLSAIIDEAAATQVATENQVADNIVREELAGALENATTARDTEVDRTSLEAVQGMTDAITTAAEALTTAHSSVQDAHSAWNEQQAAAQEAAAQAAAEAAKSVRRSPSGTRAGTSSTGTNSPATRAPSGAAPAPSTGATTPVAPPADQGYYLEVETTTQEDMKWCFDTSGASWQC